MKVISIIYIILLAVALTGCSTRTEPPNTNASEVSSVETEPAEQVKTLHFAEQVSTTAPETTEPTEEETEPAAAAEAFKYSALVSTPKPTEAVKSTETTVANTPTDTPTDTPTETDVSPTETAPLPEDMDERGYLQFVSQREIEMLACIVDWEIGSGTLIEKQAVVWCVLNRVDAGSAGGFRDTVYGVLTQSGQFRSYYGTGSNESYNIVVDCLTLWQMEKQSGYPIDGRVLPRDYCWYHGDGRHNYFRNAYSGGSYWDWSWTGGF